jgi:hypothetical protein
MLVGVGLACSEAIGFEPLPGSTRSFRYSLPRPSSVIDLSLRVPEPLAFVTQSPPCSAPTDSIGVEQ